MWKRPRSLNTFSWSKSLSPLFFQRKHQKFERQISTKKNGPLRLVLIGLPGSGKGTQSSKLEKDYNLVPISSGHLLRMAVAEGSPIGKIAEKQMIGGGLVSNEIILQLIKETLVKKCGTENWLLDGFPRNLEQAKLLEILLEEVKQPLTHIFYLDVPEKVIYQRLKERLVHTPSGRIYNLSFNPPKVPGKDDITGEPLTKRGDDNEETVRARLETYRKSTIPLLDFYRKKQTMYTIDSPTSAVGYVQIQRILGL